MGDKSTIQQWWDGNSTRAWRSLCVLIFTAVVAMTSWGLAKVTELPEKYVCKSDYQADQSRRDRMLERIESKVDETNRYLRNHGGGNGD